jgi:hypothetical protein
VKKIRLLYSNLKWFCANYSKLNQYKKTEGAFMYGPIVYNTDGLATCLNCDFITDSKFQKAYSAAADTKPWDGFTLQWRVYIVCFFAEHVKSLNGDFVECGVNTGAYAKAIIQYTNFNDTGKMFHLLDTYNGLVSELVSQEEKDAGLENYLKQYKNVYEKVVETFKNDKVNLIKGIVPETLPLCKTEKIAYLSIDMNCVEPEIMALEYFYEKVVSGGVIILDDYGFPQHKNQKMAHDQFAKRKAISILSLPTGQGIIFKK